MRSEIENVGANVIRYKAHYVVESEWIDENSVSNDFDYESNEGVIVLKDGVTEIGEGAFTDSFDIVSVGIPNTITNSHRTFIYPIYFSFVTDDWPSWYGYQPSSWPPHFHEHPLCTASFWPSSSPWNHPFQAYPSWNHP